MPNLRLLEEIDLYSYGMLRLEPLHGVSLDIWAKYM